MEDQMIAGGEDWKKRGGREGRGIDRLGKEEREEEIDGKEDTRKGKNEKNRSEEEKSIV